MHGHPLRRLAARAVAATTALVLTAAPVRACTTLLLGQPGERLVAYSYDRRGSGAGIVVINPRGVERVSLASTAPARWRSRHLSLTLNQFGPGMPIAGLNDAGLVVTLMWNDAVAWAAAPAGPRVNELELIQYLLDSAASVAEALDHTRGVAVEGRIPIQYLIADASGQAAVVEHHDGRLKIDRDGLAAFPALTNTGHAQARASLGRWAEFGGAEPLPPYAPATGLAGPEESNLRFAHAVSAAAARRSGVTPGEAFAALETVRNDATRWQLVLDAAGRALHLRVPGGATTVLRLEAIEPGCGEAVQAAPVSAPGRFTTLTPAASAALSSETLAGLPGFTPEAARTLAPALAAAQHAALRCAGEAR
jgi:hypothetical protein